MWWAMPTLLREGPYRIHFYSQDCLQEPPHVHVQRAWHEAARILDAEINEDEVTVHLEDGRSVTTPLEWYPRLAFATPEERQNFEIVGRGRGLHWPMLDEDLSVKGMLSGTPSAEGPRSLKGWKKALKKRRRLRAAGETPPPWGTGTYRIPYRAFLDEDTSE
jgi:hypothetical protein